VAAGDGNGSHEEPRSLDDLRGEVEELRAQLHWVRDYL
jgi:hypothetical protein